MQSRDTRFSLRIESGDRQGEAVALPEGVLTVGRRPDSGLVLADASVSGRHAELRVKGDTVEVADTGSTNGTRIDGHKIENAHLEHGDSVLFGNVKVQLWDLRRASPGGAPDDDEVSLEDVDLEEPEVPRAKASPRTSAASAAPTAKGPAGASGTPAAVPASAALGRVSADALTRSAAGAKRWPLFVLLAAALGGGAFVVMRNLSGDAGGRKAALVPDVPGNQIEDGSFESGEAEWTAAEAAPVGFVRDRSHARSGQLGLGASLEAGEWALARSPEFAVHSRKRLRLGADLRVTEGTVGRVGLWLSSSTQLLPSATAWVPAVSASGDFALQQLAFDTFGEYDRASVVVAARDAGTLSVDDVSVLEEDAVGGAPRFNEYEFAVLGSPGSSAALARSGRVLLGGIGLGSWGRSGLSGWAEARLGAGATERGFRLAFRAAPPTAELSFQALRPAAGAGSAAEAGWAATMGPDGYAAHGTEFQRENVTALLLGSGSELLRIGFERPVTIISAGIEGAQLVRIVLGGLEECEFQLTFVAERVEAATLEDRAQDSERDGDLGAALRAWSELLDRYPFERARVVRAEAARGRLVQNGLARVDEIRRELERARFFGLADLFRAERLRAESLAEQYRESEVEVEARAVAQLAGVEEQRLAQGGRSGQRTVLEGVLASFDRGASPRLAAHVENAVQAAMSASEERTRNAPR